MNKPQEVCPSYQGSPLSMSDKKQAYCNKQSSPPFLDGFALPQPLSRRLRRRYPIRRRVYPKRSSNSNLSCGEKDNDQSTDTPDRSSKPSQTKEPSGSVSKRRRRSLVSGPTSTAPTSVACPLNSTTLPDYTLEGKRKRRSSRNKRESDLAAKRRPLAPGTLLARRLARLAWDGAAEEVQSFISAIEPPAKQIHPPKNFIESIDSPVECLELHQAKVGQYGNRTDNKRFNYNSVTCAEGELHPLAPQYGHGEASSPQQLNSKGTDEIGPYELLYGKKTGAKNETPFPIMPERNYQTQYSVDELYSHFDNSLDSENSGDGWLSWTDRKVEFQEMEEKSLHDLPMVDCMLKRTEEVIAARKTTEEESVGRSDELGQFEAIQSDMGGQRVEKSDDIHCLDILSAFIDTDASEWDLV